MQKRIGIGLLLLATFFIGNPASAGEPWGADTNPGDGPRLIEAAAPTLARIVAAAPAERAKLIADYVAGKAPDQIEAIKRFRNPELHDLFVALAKKGSWKVRHRALFALEYYGRSTDLPLAFAALHAKEPRLREKAAITAIKLFGPKGAKLVGEDPLKTVEKLADQETDIHLIGAFRALELRIEGKLPIGKVYQEHLEKRSDGLLITPFLNGMDKLAAVAPTYTKKGVSETGGGSAARLPAEPYTTPLLEFRHEARSGLSLQPFANLRGGGSVYHTGLDVNACLDGSGYYAIAPGIVKFIYSGSDMGTLLVVQSNLGDRRTVNAVYMHGGDTVFVKAGEKVQPGQLLATMGMGFSIENGGHFAHLHFGLYPGKFSVTHNYGYRSVKAGLADWYDPAFYIPLWVELTRPLVPLHRSVEELGRAAKLLARDEPGKAYEAAKREGEAGQKLRAEIEKAVGGAVDRAKAMRDAGYPTKALEFLEQVEKSARRVPGADKVSEAVKEWKRDRKLKEAMRDEKKIDRTEDEAIAFADAGKPGKAEDLWKKLLTACASTCLAPRIREFVKGVALRQ